MIKRNTVCAALFQIERAHQRIRQAALDRPPPKAHMAIRSPFFSFPLLASSSKEIGTLAEDVFP